MRYEVYVSPPDHHAVGVCVATTTSWRRACNLVRKFNTLAGDRKSLVWWGILALDADTGVITHGWVLTARDTIVNVF